MKRKIPKGAPKEIQQKNETERYNIRVKTYQIEDDSLLRWQGQGNAGHARVSCRAGDLAILILPSEKSCPNNLE